jgi:hypothetical protein
MGFPMRTCQVRFDQVHAPSHYHFLKRTKARIQANFFIKRKGQRKVKPDCFDPNKFMVPFDYTDTKQSKSTQAIQGATKVNSPMRGRLDHIPQLLDSRLSRPLLTAIGRNQNCAQSMRVKGIARTLNIQYFTTAIHSPKRPQLVQAHMISFRKIETGR